MNEKRFAYGETDLFEWVEDNGEMISTKECVDKLNELYEEIGKLFDRIDEQQAIIQQLEKDKAILKERLRECGMRVDRFNCR